MDSLKDNLNNNESNKFNNDLFPNFENLSEGTLRRYQAYFNLRTENGGIAKPKNELINLVKDHFNKFEVDNETISNMSTKYDSKYDSNYYTSDFCYLNMDDSNNKYEDVAYEIYDNVFLSSNYGDLTDEEISEFILELFKLFQENNG